MIFLVLKKLSFFFIVHREEWTEVAFYRLQRRRRPSITRLHRDARSTADQ